MTKWIVGGYLRLSNDDNLLEESNSIVNQRDILNQFLKNQSDMKLYKFYVDDGYTGTDFNRPGFQELMADIKDAKINSVIVKDLSRIGRNYIEVGNFVEEIVPLYKLRFMSINDNVDSVLNPQSLTSLEIPFKNLINEAYAKDISKKVRSALRIRKQKGDFIGVVAPYGYIKNPYDKHKIIVDKEASNIVKKIFNLALSGKSRQEIVAYLNDYHILTPSSYMKIRNNFKGGNVSKIWSVKMVDKILNNKTYIGYLVQGKNTRISHKIHNCVSVSEKDWIIIKNHHEAIIEEKIFNQVQNVLYGRNNMVNSQGKYNIFTGHLKCYDCGSNLYRSTKSNGKHAFYYCGTYKRKKGCSKHYITEDDLIELVLSVLNKYINILCDIESDINKVVFDSKLYYNLEVQKIRNAEISEEIKKYEMLMDELLKDFKNKEINKDEFDDYSQEYLYVLNSYRIALEENQKSAVSINLDWINQFKKIKNIDILSKSIVDEFIENIFIREDGSINIVFKYNNEYEDALKFLKLNNV